MSDVSGWWFECHRDGQLRAVKWKGVLGLSLGQGQLTSGCSGPDDLSPQDSAAVGDTDQRGQGIVQNKKMSAMESYTF